MPPKKKTAAAEGGEAKGGVYFYPSSIYSTSHQLTPTLGFPLDAREREEGKPPLKMPDDW